MKLWNAKRFGYTAVCLVISSFLLWTLIDLLSQEGVPPIIVLIVLIFSAGCYGMMIIGLGEAAARMEMAKKSQIPQTWSRSVNETAGCDLCPERETFLHCKTHGWSLCWECGYRHNKNNPECVLIPFGTPELVK